MCTIHQPSALLFQEFNHLLFLASGGRTAYVRSYAGNGLPTNRALIRYFGDIGKDSTTLIQYFQRNGSRLCGSSENPAEWMLDVIGAAPGSQNTIDWPQVWRESPEKARIKLQLAEMKNELSSKPVNDTPDSLKEYAASFTGQFYVVTKRIFEQYWRTPSYLYSKTLLCAGSVSYSPAAFYKSMC